MTYTSASGRNCLHRSTTSRPFRSAILRSVNTTSNASCFSFATPATGGKMKTATDAFLASLSPELKKKASFDFNDKHRAAWFFTPQQDKEKKFTRKGARLEEMTTEQKKAAMGLLKSGLSAKGYEQATTIVGLEALLADYEGAKGALVRNTGWYFVRVFGAPSDTVR